MKKGLKQETTTQGVQLRPTTVEYLLLSELYALLRYFLVSLPSVSTLNLALILDTNPEEGAAKKSKKKPNHFIHARVKWNYLYI